MGNCGPSYLVGEGRACGDLALSRTGDGEDAGPGTDRWAMYPVVF